MNRAIATIALMLALYSGASAQQMQSPAETIAQKFAKARPLPLSAVRLTGGPMKAAQDADAKFLLSLDPDRVVAFLREAAGLQSKAAGLGGWDGGKGRQLTGHIAGHFLSALSLMYAATGDEAFKKKADYMVDQLGEVQDKQGDGYIGAQQTAQGVAAKTIFAELAQSSLQANYETLNGLWSPWYVEHKLFAGLRDAYRQTGNKKALDVEKKLAAWTEKTLAPLSEAQLQKMLGGEFGGMNEVLTDLYADTGEKRWLDLSYKFEDRVFLDPLVQKKDIVGGQHGNHNIPKMVGLADRFAYTGKAGDLAAADFFWDAVVNHHTFASGGDSCDGDGEHFPQADALGAAIGRRPSAPTNESCNVYNMLKLTRDLFAIEPRVQYADYMERALYNHILAQIDPATGAMAYHVPIGQNVRMADQNLGGKINEIFSCCVGTGMESHALDAAGLYYEAGDKLWVNYYAPNTAKWTMAGAELKMESDLPLGESVKITMTVKTPKELTLALRRPVWTTKEFKITVNGKAVAITGETDDKAGRYLEIKRTWQSGDVVNLTIPKSLRIEPTPDMPGLVAIMWGPLVLGEDLAPAGGARGARGALARGGPGRGPAASLPSSPFLVSDSRNPADWLKPVDGKPGEFHSTGTGRALTPLGEAAELTFVPLYQLHGHQYSVYTNVFTNQEWASRSKAAGSAIAN